MIFSIYNDSCNVILDDDFYLEFKDRVYSPTESDEDIYDDIAARLELYVYLAVTSVFNVDRGDGAVKIAQTILTGSNEEEKQIIYDKCEEYLRDDMEVYEVLDSRDFDVAVQTMIQAQQRELESDVLQRNAYKNPPEKMPMPIELFSNNEAQKDESIKQLFDLFKENGIINLDNWIIYYHCYEREIESVSISNPECINRMEKPEHVAMISGYYKSDNEILHEMGWGESVDKLMDCDEIPSDILFEWFKHIMDDIILEKVV